MFKESLFLEIELFLFVTVHRFQLPFIVLRKKKKGGKIGNPMIDPLNHRYFAPSRIFLAFPSLGRSIPSKREFLMAYLEAAERCRII